MNFLVVYYRVYVPADDDWMVRLTRPNHWYESGWMIYLFYGQDRERAHQVLFNTFGDRLIETNITNVEG